MNEYAIISHGPERCLTMLGGFEFLESVSGCVDESTTASRPSQTLRKCLSACIKSASAHDRILSGSDESPIRRGQLTVSLKIKRYHPEHNF